jgi:hypothetical protein
LAAQWGKSPAPAAAPAHQKLHVGGCHPARSVPDQATTWLPKRGRNARGSSRHHQRHLRSIGRSIGTTSRESLFPLRLRRQHLLWSHDDTDATINSTTRRGSLTAAAAAAEASTSNDKGQTSQSRCAAVGVRTKHTKVGAQVCPEQNDRDDLGAQGGAGGGFSLARRQYRFAKVGNGLGQLTSSPEN